MPGRNSRKQDPFYRINSWDDGYEYIQGKIPSPSDARNAPPFYSPPPMSGARHPPLEPNMPRRHGNGADERRTRRRDNSPLSDYDAPRRRHHRDDSPPPYRSVESHSPTRRGRYDEPAERLPRRKSMGNAPPSRPHPGFPSPPRRSERDDRYGRDRAQRRQERYRSPSPADRGRRRGSSPAGDRYARSSPTRHRAQPQQPSASGPHPGISRSKTTPSKGAGAGLSPRWQQAATAAFQAGSLAALTMRSEPGAWNGAKGARVVSAALGAGVMKAAGKQSDEDKGRSGGGGGGGRSSLGGSSKSKGMEVIGSALTGFVAQQLAKRAQKGGPR